MNIKNWISNKIYIWEHNKNANRLNSDLEKNYYRPKSKSIIKILSEIDKKAGLSVYDIVPFLKKINLMPTRHSYIEEGSGGTATDRKRNSELFNELEKLELIKIIENKLYSNSHGVNYPTPAEDCILKVKLLPKGLDYLKDHKSKRFDKNLKILLAFFSASAFFISIYNLTKPTTEKYNELERKVDSLSNQIEKKKEENLRPIDKQPDSSNIHNSSRGFSNRAHKE